MLYKKKKKKDCVAFRRVGEKKECFKATLIVLIQPKLKTVK